MRVLIAMLAAFALLAAACGDGDDAGSGLPATSAPPMTPDAEATTDLNPGTEVGSEPVFWRTEDRFASLQAGQAYKVVLRVTANYDDPTLTISAQKGQGVKEERLEATRATPLGTDAPGSYYVLSLTLPEPGQWTLTVERIQDAEPLTVRVGDAEPTATPSTRY